MYTALANDISNKVCAYDAQCIVLAEQFIYAIITLGKDLLHVRWFIR